MYPAAFEYFAPRTRRRGARAAGAPRRRRQDPCRRAEPAADDEAADRQPALPDRRQPDRRAWRTPPSTAIAWSSARCAAMPICSPRRSCASTLPIMIDAANQTADVQVRNRGTLAGSLAHADPAGDWPAALMALDTTVTIAGRDGPRTPAARRLHRRRLHDADGIRRNDHRSVGGDSRGARAAGHIVKFEKTGRRFRGRQRRRSADGG